MSTFAILNFFRQKITKVFSQVAFACKCQILISIAFMFSNLICVYKMNQSTFEGKFGKYFVCLHEYLYAKCKEAWIVFKQFNFLPISTS